VGGGEDKDPVTVATEEHSSPVVGIISAVEPDTAPSGGSSPHSSSHSSSPKMV